MQRPDWNKTGSEALLERLALPDDHAARVKAGHERISGQMECFGDRRPSLLYHYTSAATAAAIVQSRSMRASNLFYMNDATELSHGMSVLLGVLQERIDAGGDPLAMRACQA